MASDAEFERAARIKIYQCTLEEYDEQIKKLLAERSAQEQAMLALMSPWPIGAIIQWNRGQRRCIGRIEGFQFSPVRDVTFLCRQIQSNGSYGRRCLVQSQDDPILYETPTNNKPVAD